MARASTKKFREVMVRDKVTGKEFDGILYETSRGIYFKPKSIIDWLKED